MPDLINQYFPDFISTRSDSTLSEYVFNFELEVERHIADVNAILLSHRVDKVELNDNSPTRELDRIGALFGDVGERRGRDDEEYQRYLKAVVPIFAGRGEVPSVRRVAAVGLGIDEDDVTIVEYFEELEFSVIFDDWPSHRIRSVEVLMDRSSPSVVRLRTIQYNIPQDVTNTTDQLLFDIFNNIEDITEVEDTVTDVSNILVPERVRWDNNLWDEFNWDGERESHDVTCDDSIEIEVFVDDVSDVQMLAETGHNADDIETVTGADPSTVLTFTENVAE